MWNLKIRHRKYGRLCAAVLLMGGLGILSTHVDINAQDPPGAVAESQSFTYIGDVDGGKVGVVASASDFVAYVCGGNDAFNKKCSRWMKGKVAAGKLSGAAPDGSKIEATVADDTVTGTVTTKDGTKLPFTAPKANTETTLAGLYRAEDKSDTSDIVSGWIIDEKETIVGAANDRKQGKIGTLQQGQSNVGGIGAKVASQTGTRGQPVNDPKNLPQGKQDRRFGPAVDQAKFDNKGKLVDQKKLVDQAKFDNKGKLVDQKKLVDQSKFDDLKANVSDQGGSPLAALVVQQVKRFQQTGGKAGSDLESRTFAKLKTVPGSSLTDYEKNWDKIPLAIRTAAIGGQPIDVSVPLTKERATTALRQKGGTQKKPAAKNADQPKTIARIRALDIHCTNKADLTGTDEVFAAYVVTTGAVSVDKTTSVYTGFRKGDTQPFRAADNLIFPSGGVNSPLTADAFVQAALFDDDSADKPRTIQLVTALLSVVVEIAREVGDATGGVVQSVAEFAADIVDDVNKAIETILVAFPDTVFMGSDAVIAKTNKQTQSVTGAQKSQFVFRRINKVLGTVKSQYEIRNLRVE